MQPSLTTSRSHLSHYSHYTIPSETEAPLYQQHALTRSQALWIQESFIKLNLLTRILQVKIRRARKNTILPHQLENGEFYTKETATFIKRARTHIATGQLNHNGQDEVFLRHMRSYNPNGGPSSRTKTASERRNNVEVDDENDDLIEGLDDDEGLEEGSSSSSGIGDDQ
jgi:hypothetical protein